MSEPLVSVVCLCFNQREYVVEAMDSVLKQSYENVELIVVDDGSSDDSQQVIKAYCATKPQVRTVLLETNVGHCAAFNKGWCLAGGKYIIDLAADDYLLPERIAVGVKILEEKGLGFGVHFADVRMVSKSGQTISDHLTDNFYDPVPEGYLFIQLLEKYFINPASMMIANEVLKTLGGYDESLAFEDFDFWVRSSKNWQYCYSPKVLVVKRLLETSQSAGQYKFRSDMLKSTCQVCEKALELCENGDEYRALRKRIIYEMKKSIQSFNLKTALDFFALLNRTRNRLKELS